MKKWMLWGVVFAVGPFLAAQDSAMLGKEAFWAAVKQYHPAVLAMAAQSPDYQQILNQVAAAYSKPNTEENQYELIALVKNFNNSLRLLQLRQEYKQGLLLQRMSGTELASLESQISRRLTEVAEDVFRVTVEVREMQVKNYKEQLKALKKDASLAAEDKEQRRAAIARRLQETKNIVKQLKRTRRQAIQEAASVQWQTIQAETTAAQEEIFSVPLQNPKSAV